MHHVSRVSGRTDAARSFTRTALPLILRSLRNRHFLALDACCLVAASFLAFSLRFEGFGWTHSIFRPVALTYVAITVPLRLFVFHRFGLYQRLWRDASVAELATISLAGSVAGVVASVVGLVVLPGLMHLMRVPISVVSVDAVLTFAFITFPRLLARLTAWRLDIRSHELRDAPRALIVGAGTAGLLAAREMRANPQVGLKLVGFLDDDPTLRRLRVCDLPVLGTLDELGRVVAEHEVAEVIIAMPSAPGSAIRRVVELARRAGVHARTIPALHEILSGHVAVTNLREVQIQDLLRRAPIETNLDAVAALTHAKTVMITGAGGSIGSELCRQLVRLQPSELILLGHGENSIFEIHQELSRLFPERRLRPIIADIRDRSRIDALVKRHRPSAIFHAAAHKHVPLMEANVGEALANNVIGTNNVVSAASQHGVERFVLISTDKAVRPTSIMGASKRVAEQIVQLAAADSERPYVSVRFGNVLGSRGSVVPTFLQQIRSGGPVLVTHPEMRRYFITIPEAVQLVLQAFALGRRGEVFCLDMGRAVRIVDLARDLIRLSGLEEDVDIEIRFAGIRPGEKLTEEMFFSAEQVLPTSHPKVLRARHAGLPSDVDARVEELLLATSNGAGDSELRRLLLSLVPDFTGYAPRHTIDETPLLPIATSRNGTTRNGTRRQRAETDDASVRDSNGHGDGGERRVSSM